MFLTVLQGFPRMLVQAQMPREFWAEAQGLRAPGHQMPQAQGHIGHAIPIQGGLHGVEVGAARRAADGRVEMLAMARPLQALNHYGHFLLLHAVGRGAHVALGRLAVGGGKHQLHRLDEFTQALLPVRGAVGKHDGAIDAREGLVLAVLQQAAGAHGQRAVEEFHHMAQVNLEEGRENGLAEAAADLLVVLALQRKVLQIAQLHELVEDLGAQDHGGRDGHTHAGPTLAHVRLAEQVAYKGDAPRLAAHAAFANLRQAVARIEGLRMELADNAPGAIQAIVAQQSDEVVAHLVYGGEFAYPAGLQLPAEGELCARLQPLAEMAAFGMVTHGGFRHLLQHALQRQQVPRAADGRAVRQAEDEVPKAEVLVHEGAQLLQQVAAVLAHGAHAQTLSQFKHIRLVGL